MYICPSSDDVADTLTDAAGHKVTAQQRSNFRSPRNLSYGYCSPFSSAPKFRMNTDWLAPTFAVMADKSPGVNPPDEDVTAPGLNAPASEVRKANSKNHRGAGQNVLFGDGHVSFERTPYCGYHDIGIQPDNIFTAAAPVPSTAPSALNPTKAYFGRRYAPANWEDSYIVPSENDRD
jgi:prepilin-type processing-associated H-X9-DG protein